jgi:hypothetical protein
MELLRRVAAETPQATTPGVTVRVAAEYDAAQRVAELHRGATIPFRGDAETIAQARREAPAIDAAWRDVARSQGLRNVHTAADGWTVGTHYNVKGMLAVGAIAAGVLGAGLVAGKVLHASGEHYRSEHHGAEPRTYGDAVGSWFD